MKIADAGLKLIEEFEGYHKRLPDGGCTAYQERINGKLDIPTIGFGCTKGIKMGMVWTRQQAEEALRAELHQVESEVNRLVKVSINQNEYDALVSFQYNTGGLGRSTILRRLNAGDRIGASRAFAAWNKFNGKPAAGLTRRRSAEAALFLKPVKGDVGAEFMPQQPDAPPASDTPPASMAHSTEGQGAVMAGGSGNLVMFTQMQTAAKAARESGTFDLATFVWELATDPVFCASAVVVLCAAYWFFKRRARLYLDGV